MAKYRLGFVSNSSSSSFVCDFCGAVDSGFDCSLDDFDMSRCENGHEFCNSHMDKEFDEETVDGFKYILKLIENNKTYCIQQGKDDSLINCIKFCIEHNMCTFDDMQEVLEEKFGNKELTEEEFNNYHANFEDYVHDELYDYGIPEEYCPVCQRAKKMKQDPDYNEYNRLYSKFDGVNPYGCK